MIEVPASDAAVGIEPLELDDGALVEACVLLVKVSQPDGRGTVHRAMTKGMSWWEALGMLDAAHHDMLTDFGGDDYDEPEP